MTLAAVEKGEEEEMGVVLCSPPWSHGGGEERTGESGGEAAVHQRLLSMCLQGCPCLATSVCWHVWALRMPEPQSAASMTCSCVPAPTGIMLGRMGDSGVPLVSFCQCLNESVMKIVAVAVW